MTDPQAPGAHAFGIRSVAAGQIGIAATGDRPHIDARAINVVAGTIPGPSDVAAPPGTHNLPRPPAKVFVGRDYALSRLTSLLADGASVVVTQAIYGLGGVGKSELVLHHAAAHRADYTLIWWITAEDGIQIQAGLAALAARLCREIALVGTTTDAAGWAVAWLQAHRRWLLIMDNVTDPGDVDELLGQLTGGHILVTTRRDTGWDQIADPIRLDVLDPGSAADLITLRTGYGDAADCDIAAAIAGELGNLPLALEQAAAYVIQTLITPAVYLQRLRDHPAEMYVAGGSGDAQRTIARVWDITLEAIRARHRAAITLLHILACYAPDSVPRAILGGPDDTVKLAVDEALGVLASYSMVTLTAETVSMHRLVQAVLLARHPPEDQSSAFGGKSPPVTALEWLNAAIAAEPGFPPRILFLTALFPHADKLAIVFPPGSHPQTLGPIMKAFGLLPRSRDQYRFARVLLRLWEEENKG